MQQIIIQFSGRSEGGQVLCYGASVPYFSGSGFGAAPGSAKSRGRVADYPFLKAEAAAGCISKSAKRALSRSQASGKIGSDKRLRTASAIKPQKLLGACGFLCGLSAFY